MNIYNIIPRAFIWCEVFNVVLLTYWNDFDPKMNLVDFSVILNNRIFAGSKGFESSSSY